MELLPRRLVLALLLSISLSFFWYGRATDCGGNQIAYTIKVDQSGHGDFKTIQAAIDSIKQNNDRWVKVYINAGTYTEKVQIPNYKPCVILKGDSSSTTIIRYDDHQETDTSATFISRPPNVVASGITFKNSYNLDGSRNRVVPAVAASIYGDKSAFYDCSFLGYQDTLFDVEGRHYFKDCYIQGEVDFIFGSGQSYYEGCVMNATEGSSSPSGFVTAQRRNSPDDPSGFVFMNGSVVGIGQVKLGRAYGPYSRVIYYGTYFSSVVAPRGWDAWNFVGKEYQFTYAEVDCTGPGADTSKRVSWAKKLSSSELSEYWLSNFINKDGWLSNVPNNIL